MNRTLLLWPRSGHIQRTCTSTRYSLLLRACSCAVGLPHARRDIWWNAAQAATPNSKSACRFLQMLMQMPFQVQTKVCIA